MGANSSNRRLRIPSLGLLLAGFVLCSIATAQSKPASTVVHLFTEDFPPYSMSHGGDSNTFSPSEVTGFVTEIIKELFLRAEINYTLELVPWKRAYDTTLASPNYGVFTTTRTEAREELFAWVSPVVNMNWVLMGKTDSNIQLESLEQAKQFTVGGYLNDAIAEHLETRGFNIAYVANDVLNVRKLMRDRIDLWPVVQQKGHWLASSEGYEVKEIFTIMSTQADLAMNIDTDPEIIIKLNSELAKMHKDGTIEKITDSFLFEGKAVSAK